MVIDVVIAGAGPGGLSAALCLGRGGRQVLVLDSGSWRNVPSGTIHNFLSRDGVTPDEPRASVLAQLRQYPSVKVQQAAAEAADGEPGDFEVALDDGRIVRAHRLVLATGVEDVLPDIPGLNERWGQSVVHCPYCHGWERAGLKLGVLALNEWAVPQEALYCHAPTRQRSGLAAQLGCRLLDDGAVEVNEFGQATRPGIYAIGDMARTAGNPFAGHQVIMAAAAGTAAAIVIDQELLYSD